MNWISMCLWMPTMGTTRSLGNLSLGCSWWWDQHPQHGYINTRLRWKPQLLVPSWQLWRRLSRSLLCSNITFIQMGTKVCKPTSIFLDNMSVVLNVTNPGITLKNKPLRLATILLGIILITIFCRWGIYTKDNFACSFTKPLVSIYLHFLSWVHSEPIRRILVYIPDNRTWVEKLKIY